MLHDRRTRRPNFPQIAWWGEGESEKRKVKNENEENSVSSFSLYRFAIFALRFASITAYGSTRTTLTCSARNCQIASMSASAMRTQPIDFC